MSTVGKLSREEWRKQKDLDAARKAGTAPAEIGEDGEVINPHVPDYMSKAPWYLDTGKRSLKHQKKPETGEEFVGLNDWYARGQKAGPAATKYRKGACENCGAATHKTKDCLERPRKKGAKWSGKDIAPDEHVTDFGGKKIDFAAKRDRWNGYDPAEHKRIMEDYEAVEEERRRLREEEIDKQTSTDLSSAKEAAKKGSKKDKKTAKDDGDFSSSDEEDEDDDKYAEAANMAGQKVDTDNRMSIRNLRIREDRAKYLYNLNPESAYYDPKTRSMREAPDAGIRPEDSQYAGDNYNRAKGDTLAMQRLQLFAWQAEARGNDLHLQANPTVNEKQFREFQEKKEKLRQSTKGSILEKYGGAEHFDSVPKELLTGQTENYVEYSRAGQIIRGQERAKVKSRFEEDVYDNNHTTVWGSWYDLTTGQWGYKCCHSTVNNSYCTGEAGIEASKASIVLSAPKPLEATTTTVAAEASGSGSGAQQASEGTKARSKRRASSRSRSTSRSPSSYSSSSSYSSASDSDFSSSTDSEREKVEKAHHRDGDRQRAHRRRRREGSSSRDRERKHHTKRSRHHSSHHSHRRKRRSSSSSFSDSGSSDEHLPTSSSSFSNLKKDVAPREKKGFVSRKNLGEGDVSSRLDKEKLARALREEDLRRGLTTSSSSKDKDNSTKGKEKEVKKKKKPDWLIEAESINSGALKRNRKGEIISSTLALTEQEEEANVGSVNHAGQSDEVTEEQMEAYRLKSRNAYEDPMAGYRDVDEL